MFDWDPNLIPEMCGELEPCRIYGDDDASIFALVSAIDYQWALKYKWSPKWSRGGRKVYLRRVQQTTLVPGTKTDRTRLQQTVWLHIEIMKRTGVVPPDLFHTIVDHRNGDGLDCQRHNLRWATPSMNRNNINAPHNFRH